MPAVLSMEVAEVVGNYVRDCATAARATTIAKQWYIALGGALKNENQNASLLDTTYWSTADARRMLANQFAMGHTPECRLTISAQRGKGSDEGPAACLSRLILLQKLQVVLPRAAAATTVMMQPTQIAPLKNLRELTIDVSEASSKFPMFPKFDALQDSLMKLKRFELVGGTLRKGALLPLATLTALRELVLNNCGGLASKDDTGISSLRQLTMLTASNGTVVDSRFLAPLVRLEQLQLSSSEFTSRHLLHMKRLKKLTLTGNSARWFPPELATVLADVLEELNLALNKLNTAEVEHLNGLKVLQRLVMRHVDPALLGPLPSIRHLHVGYSFTPNDATIQSLATRKALESLTLEGVALSSEHLSGLVPLSSTLTALNLTSTKCCDAGIEALHSFKRLTTLRVANCSLGRRAISVIGTFTQLRTLDLGHLAGGSGGGEPLLAPLAALTRVEVLDLTCAAVDDADISELVGMACLHTLGLALTNITGKSLETIAKSFPAMEVLDVSAKGVTSGSIAWLGQLSKLRRLVAKKADVSSVPSVATIRGWFPRHQPVEIAL